MHGKKNSSLDRKKFVWFHCHVMSYCIGSCIPRTRIIFTPQVDSPGCDICAILGLDGFETTPMSKATEYASDEALVSLIALLEPAAFPLEDYHDALIRAQGDLSRAAELLLVPEASSSSGLKRKRGLQSWLTPTIPTEWAKTPQSSGSPSPSPPRKSVDRGASAASWATLLRNAPPKATGPEKPLRSAPQRALHLATQSAINAHKLPLALLESPLTPAFAAALYHQMLGESPTWPYNKFFLAGREVESNHQSVTYARRGGGFEFTQGGSYYYTGSKYKAKVENA